MSAHDQFDDTVQSHILLSRELLLLLHWLAHHGQKHLRHAVRVALEARATSEQAHDEHILPQESMELEDVQEGILEFLGILDELIAQESARITKRRAREQQLMPTINQVDTAVCDDGTIQKSVQKATKLAERGHKEDAKIMLMREILRQWMPVDEDEKGLN